jgi:hypothetical protein
LGLERQPFQHAQPELFLAAAVLLFATAAPQLVHAQTILKEELPVDHRWWNCLENQSRPLPYPSRAMDRGIEGVAEVQCRVKDSKIEACTWISEKPSGYGFGDSAQRMACSFKFQDNPGGPQQFLFKAPITFKAR